MYSLIQPGVPSDIINRLVQLSPEAKPQWGKMSVSQMLAHCQVPLKLALGELQLKGGLMGFLFGKIAKKSLISAEPFKRNLPTFKEAKIAGEKSFDNEKAALTGLIRKIAAGPEIITKNKHPFFGPLTVDEWDTLQVKHLDHHLRQFGV